MTPLPRLLACSDDRIATLDDLGIRAAAIAAAGPAVGLVARLPHGSADQLTSLAQRFAALATPPMATLFVTGRADVAMAVRAHGVILRSSDLAIDPVRHLFAGGRHPGTASRYILRSVHSESEAESAAREGADALIVGTIWPSATHADYAPAGTGLLKRVVSLGVPVYAIGGLTPVRAVEARAAGAWGVAAISAVWDADQPYRAAMEMLKPWTEMG